MLKYLIQPLHFWFRIFSIASCRCQKGSVSGRSRRENRTVFHAIGSCITPNICNVRQFNLGPPSPTFMGDGLIKDWFEHKIVFLFVFPSPLRIKLWVEGLRSWPIQVQSNNKTSGRQLTQCKTFSALFIQKARCNRSSHCPLSTTYYHWTHIWKLTANV